MPNLSALLACCLFISAASPPPQSAPTPPASPAPANSQQQMERLQRVLHDYGNLARYHEDDVKLASPATGERRVVFMGDSITDSWGRRYGKFFPGKPYINRGISGQVTPQMLIRFQQDVIDLKPKVVVILAGVNDIAGSLGPVPDYATKNNLMAMAELARVHQIRVVLSSLTPVCDAIQSQVPPEKLRALSVWIQTYAAGHNVTYLDYYSKMIDDKGLLRPNLSIDCLHPNDAGFAIMEPLAEQAIQKALQ